MRCLIIFAHPDPASYGRALLDAALEGLDAAGNEVDVIDLYEMGFDPRLSAYELDNYLEIGKNHPALAHEIELLQNAEALIFIYPTWWSGLPAILKGFIDRVFLPEVAFRLDEESTFLKPNLGNVRRLVGVTTYGSPHWLMRLVNDSGRRTLLRTIRLNCSWRCRSSWLGLHKMDGASEAERELFINDVRSFMAGLP